MAMPKILPSTRTLVWGLILGLAAVALVNNVRFLADLTKPRS